MSDSVNVLRLRLVDRIADEFEAAFQAASSASIEDYLAEAPEDCRRALFEELLAVEVELRQDRGEQPQTSDYERRFAEFADEIRKVFEPATQTGDSQVTLPIVTGLSETAGPALAVERRNGSELVARITVSPFAKPGLQFGRFQLLEELGSGGFGTVWKAHDTVLKRLVALKFPQAGSLCPRNASLLMREARSAARLKHAGIVQVHDAGEVGGTTYIASEYIHGTSLHEHLRAQRLPCRRAAEICHRVAAGLHHAHELGIVHRDLKPGNILLDRAGDPHVADFGLAKTEEAEALAGQFVGTASYMSPEQASGRSDDVDRRSDVYSLGVILYEMLTGSRPSPGKGAELLENIQTVTPRRPRQLNPAIPRDLEAICRRCLNKAPADRYPTAGELAEDLERFLRGEPVAARPLSAPRRLVRWARRRPALAALTATSALLLLSLVAVGAASYGEIARALERAEVQLYFHRVVAADRAWQANDVGEFERLLDDCPKHLRGWEWGYLRSLSDSADVMLDNAGGAVAFSPEGKLIATGGGDNWNVKLWDTATGRQEGSLEGHQSHVSSLDFSDDGTWLASAGGKDALVILWQVADRQKVATLRGHAGPIPWVRFLPGAKQVISASVDGTIRVWDAAAKKELLKIEHGAIHIRSMALSADGQLVALATGSGAKAQVRVWEIASGEKVWDVPAFDRASGVAFSPDSRQLAVAASRDLVRVWDVASRELVQAYAIVPTAAPEIAYSSAGKLLAATAWDGSVALVDTRSGWISSSVRGHYGEVRQLAFAPGGELMALATSADRVYVHRTQSEQGSVVLEGHQGRVVGAAFLAGSPRILSGGNDGTVRLWDVAQGRQIRLLAERPVPIHGVSSAADGRTVAAIGKDGLIHLWDADKGELRHELAGDAGPFHDLTFDPSGTCLASASGTGEVTLWDASTGERRESFSAQCAPICRVLYSPCGRWLAVGARGCEVHVFDAKTLELVEQLSLGAPVSGLAFSKDGTLAATGADASARFWDVTTGNILWELPATGVLRQVDLAFDPDGARVALAVGGEAVTLWHAAHRQRLIALRRHADVAGLVTVSPDGTYIASASGNGAIRVWSARGRDRGHGHSAAR